ncbi:MAG: cupredoxin domain-containing protein [Candidatus Dormibacteraceae bacterium]
MPTGLRRLTLLFATAVLIAGCGGSTAATSTATSDSSAAAGAVNPTPPAGAVRVSLLDFSITPAKISVPAGAITLYVTNDGKTPHNFTIRSPRGPVGAATKIVAHTRDLNPGQADLLVTTLPAGDYTFYCAFAGHEQLGMTGDFTVA